MLVLEEIQYIVQCSLAWLDPSLPARECNCDGRLRKRGGEKGLAHFIFQLRNLTNLVGMRIVGFQVCCGSVCKQACTPST